MRRLQRNGEGVSKNITEAELAEMEGRAQKATDGPWEVGRCSWACDGWACGVTHGRSGDIYDDPIFKSDARDECTHIINEQDATFIARARTDVPRLIAEVRRLREAMCGFCICWVDHGPKCQCENDE